MQTALGGGHFLALAIFGEESFFSFEIFGSEFFFAFFELVAQLLHRGLDVRFGDFRLFVAHGCDETFEEFCGLEVGEADAKTSDLLGKLATVLEAEAVGRIRFDLLRCECWCRGSSRSGGSSSCFDGSGGSFCWFGGFFCRSCGFFSLLSVDGDGGSEHQHAGDEG